MSVFFCHPAIAHMILHYESFFLSSERQWLVFIHGAGGSMLTWKYQLDAFKPFFNLLLLDLRDHGKSKGVAPYREKYTIDLLGEDILILLDQLKIRKAHFMSLSLGSIFVQFIGDKRPDLIDRAIMAGAVCKANIPMKVLAFVSRVVYPLLSFEQSYKLLSFAILPRRGDRLGRKLFRAQARKMDPADFKKWMRLLNDFLRQLKVFFYHTFPAPGLIVMGAQDRVFHSAAQAYAEHQSHIQLVDMPGCGHVCNIEKPQVFNALVLRFLLEAKHPRSSSQE